ncbi:MAG: anti-virulence regulator CigR family protein [Gemmatimonadota bacterium]
MRKKRHMSAVGFLVGAGLLFAMPEDAAAQGQRKSATPSAKSAATVSVTLTPEIRVEIRDFYRSIDARGIRSLPPGIRKRLARGKPLPPGIAKQVAPAGLRSRVRVPDGYRLYEVGLDVLLVEVATNVVHDILMDVVR